MTLYEFFNTTNQTSPHYERHEKYVTDIESPTCALVQTLEYEERCAYVLMTEQCRNNDFFFDYTNYIYCQIDARNEYTMMLGALSLLMMCGYLFLILALTADGFFCPNLKVLSRMLGLSENVAGVTLLAFGNCAPDFFTSVAGMQAETRRMYSDILGSATFIVLVVAGSITAFMPFMVHGTVFLRDLLFLILDVLLLDHVINSDQTVTIMESCCILGLYTMYIFVVVMDQVMQLHNKNRSTLQQFTVRELPVLDILPTRSMIYKPRLSLDIQNSTNIFYNPTTSANHNLFQQFFTSLNVLSMDEWNESSYSMRFVIFLKIPLIFMLTVIIPVVDYEVPYNNWSKLLNTIQITTLPTLIGYVVGGEMVIYDIPLYGLVALVMLPFSLVEFLITRVDNPPSYQKLYSLLGTIGSVFVVYMAAAETINILEVLGIISCRSNSFLGCTILAWGNSIGDLVANLTLAKQGYPIMAFAACFGSPLFSSLLIIGAVIAYKSFTSGTMSYKLAAGTMGENCAVFLLIGLFALLMAVLTTNFALRRSIGYFMLTLYGLFLAYSVLGEFDIIHTYGNDHRFDTKVHQADF